VSGIEFIHLSPDDYQRAKTVLNKAKHPGFVGRELYFRCATNGRAVIASLDGQDCGVALIASNKLQALSVIKQAQGRGVGRALVMHLLPKFVNSIQERVSFFESCGYASVGAPKVGASGKMVTQLMQLTDGAGVEKQSAEITVKPAAPKLTRAEQSVEKRRRVMQIAELMASGLWNTGERLDLQDAWEVGEVCMTKYASMASLLLDVTVNDREKLLSFCQVRLRGIVMDNERDRVQAVDSLLRTIGALNVRPYEAPITQDMALNELVNIVEAYGYKVEKPKTGDGE